MSNLHITSFKDNTEQWSGVVPMNEEGELCDAIYDAADELYTDSITDIDNPLYADLVERIYLDMQQHDSASFEVGGYLYVYFNSEE